jgi:ParB/RepB/Spo0J family partition protein
MKKEALEDIEKEIAQLEAEGKKISVANKMKLKKLQRARDKAQSPIETSSVFVSSSNIDDSVRLIDMDKIAMPEFTDRTGMDREKIKELAQSIKANGLLQPILLMEDEQGGYIKIAGRRRILATKLNGETKIRAIIKEEKLSWRKFNLLVLHENTQREDLSAYDKVRFLLNFIEQEFDLSQPEAIKLCNRVNNFNKGNIVQEDIAIKGIAETLEGILEETKVFGSISHLIKHLPVLNMPIEILRLLDESRISFGLALILNKYFDVRFIEGESIDSVLHHIVSREMSIREAKEYLGSMVLKESRVIDGYSKKINAKLSKIKKMVLQLDEEKQKEFDEALTKLLSNFD